MSVAQCTKTLILVRDAGSKIELGAACRLEGSTANGAGCDVGGCLELTDCKIGGNRQIGINCGQDGVCSLSGCEIANNGMHGISANGGAISLSSCLIR